ncbi:hypothetical protein AO392_22590 [Pseudomonas putida]|nr:hypothetical protein AO392_22590 [Pseudomonas putida]
MPELKADQLARLLIKAAVNSIAVTAIDWCGVASELLITLAGVSRTQFMETLQPVPMKCFAGGENCQLQECGVAFVAGQQIAAMARRRITG